MDWDKTRHAGRVKIGGRTFRTAALHGGRLWILGGCLGVLLIGLIGCGGNKKGALSDEEAERLTFAQKPDRPDAIIVSGETITCEDLMGSSTETSTLKDRLVELAKVATLDQFKDYARPLLRQQLNGKITNVVLYKRAQRVLGKKMDSTLQGLGEKEMRRFILENGGNGAKADEALKAMGMNRTTYMEHRKKFILAQYAVSSKLSRNRPVTRSELVDRYNAMKDAKYFHPALLQFRLIDIQPAQIKRSDPNEAPLDAARALAADLISRIRAGEDFAALATEYSNGPRSGFGGLWNPRDPESSVPPYDVLSQKAMTMAVGQIADPLETPGHIFIMKVEQKQTKGYQPLAEVQSEVEDAILSDRRLEALEKLDVEVAQQTALANTDLLLDYCLERLYWLVNEPSDAQ